MRSSKSRSRSKSNRPRSIGNIINRVFDSSGPEGKVRGTPQQIIEKYQFLARDAQLSNDRVAAENFMQHAEHYTRLLAEAQRELAAEQDQRRPQDNYQSGSQNGGPQGGQGGYPQGGNQNRDRQYRDDRPDTRDEPQPDPVVVRSSPMMDFIEDINDSGLVETPETRRGDAGPGQRGDAGERRDRGPKPDRRDAVPDRRPERRDDRQPRPDRQPRLPDATQTGADGQDALVPVSAEPEPAPSAVPEAAPKRARVPRRPREAATEADAAGASGPAAAAE
jgi:hypothetical protein